MMMRDILNTRTMNCSLGLAGRLALAAFILTLVGCAQVKPQADFAQARQLFTESTGLPDIYDPDQPLLTPEEIEAVLDNGLTLQEALRLALLNNRRLHREFMSIGISKADWVQSGLLSNPTFAFSAQFPEGGGRSNIQASLAQNIVDLWQIPVRKRIAQAALDETVLRIARFGSELAADTKSAYYRAVSAEQSLSLAQDNFDLVEKSYEAVKAMRQAGTASQLDENLARGQMLRVQLKVRDARLAMHNAKRSLAQALSIGLDVDDLQLEDALRDVASPFPPADALIEMARTHRLDLRAAAKATESSYAKIDFEKLNIFPDISVGPFFERGERRALTGRKPLADFARSSIAAGAPTVPSIQPRSERNAARRQEINSIFGPALTMTLPIFDQNQAQIAKAYYLYQQNLKAYEELYLNIAQDIRMAADRTETAAGNVVFYRDEIVPQAERNLTFARDSYNAGQTSILALLEAQRLLLAAKQNYIEVRLEAASAVADMEAAIGVSTDRILESASPDTEFDHSKTLD